MMVLILAFVLFIGGQSLSADATSQKKSRKCEILVNFGTNTVSEMQASLTPGMFANVTRYAKWRWGVDATNETARNEYLCQVADATNLWELYQTLPQDYKRNFLEFAILYKGQVHELQINGGYTNIERLMKILRDMSEWKNQLQPGNTLSEKTDLTTLTKFLKVMQVKFGSRWMALLVQDENQGFLVEDPEDFAKKLYECKSVEDVVKITSLEQRESEALFSYFTGGDDTRYFFKGIDQWYIKGINLLGDLGIFNLMPN